MHIFEEVLFFKLDTKTKTGYNICVMYSAGIATVAFFFYERSKSNKTAATTALTTTVLHGGWPRLAFWH